LEDRAKLSKTMAKNRRRH